MTEHFKHKETRNPYPVDPAGCLIGSLAAVSLLGYLLHRMLFLMIHSSLRIGGLVWLSHRSGIPILYEVSSKRPMATTAPRRLDLRPLIIANPNYRIDGLEVLCGRDT